MEEKATVGALALRLLYDGGNGGGRCSPDVQKAAAADLRWWLGGGWATPIHGRVHGSYYCR
jgi:hypothetical protein